MRLFLVVAFAVLTACAPRGELRYAPDAATVGDIQRIFVGTTRQYDAEGAIYSDARAYQPQYTRFDISIPPDRALGSLPWPRKGKAVDPRKHMVAVGANGYNTADDFRRALAQEMQNSPRSDREAVVFVHGFNNTFAEGLYRFAQLYHDMDLPGVPVHYSWPSKGSVLGYAYDRDSTLFARDGLEELLEEVAASGAERIYLVAHSMGSHLTMEALRQIKMRKNTKVMNRLNGVMLISPDIDVDVFRVTAQSMGKLPQPFLIFSSKRDNALAISATLARETNRLGNLTDVEKLAGLDVTLLDTSNVAADDNHLAPGTSPVLLRLIAGARDIDGALLRDAQSRVGLLPGAVLTFQGATQVILNPVARLGE